MGNARLTRTLGRFISTLLLVYFCTAWYVCCYEIGYLLIWASQGRRFYAGIYIVLTTVIILGIVRTFLYLLLLPSDHCTPSRTLPDSALARSVPLTCSADQPLGFVSLDEELRLERCYKGRCGGVWKTGRTRHCSVCGRCRVGFDHHCPWFNNCLTLPHIKAFLLLTTLTPLGISFIAIPPTSLVMRDLGLVLAWSYASPTMRAVWWGRWYAWIPGPIGRWALGIVWSYKRYEGTVAGIGAGVGAVMGVPRGREPSLFYLVLLGMAIIFSSVALALTISTVWTLWKGELAVDRARRKAYDKMASGRASNTDTPGVDATTREKMGSMRPEIRLFIPDLETADVDADVGVRGGTVMLLPATFRVDAGHKTSLLREIWRSPLFPDYRECGNGAWDEARVRRTLRLQGYL